MTNKMTVAEAMTKAREYDKKHEDMPSVSRTLADEVEHLSAALREIVDAQYDGKHDLDTVLKAIAQKALGLPMCLLEIPEPPASDPNPRDPDYHRFRLCPNGHARYADTFDECPSCKIVRQRCADIPRNLEG